MTRPHAKQIDVPPFPDIEGQYGENPAKWLLRCRRAGTVTETTHSLLDGMESVERLDAWIYVERSLGCATFLVKALAERRRELLVRLGDAPASAPNRDDASDTASTSDNTDDQSALPGDEAAAVREAQAESEAIVEESDTDTEFDGSVGDALAIARVFGEGAVRELLEEERAQKQRPEVLEALEQRLEECAAGSQTDTQGGVRPNAV